MPGSELGALLAPWVSTAVGVFGLLIGSFLNVVIWRVPRGESLIPGSRCSHCDTAIRPWRNVPVISWLLLRGKCASCLGKIRARYPLVELGTGIAFALVAWWYLVSYGLPGEGWANALSWWLALAAYLWLMGVSIALAAIDLEHQRLPDAIVLPSIAVVTVLLAAAAGFRGDWTQLIAVCAAAAALFAFYFVVVLVYPRGLGGGDVKLAPVLGAALGYVSWGSVLVGTFAGFLIGAVVGLVVIAVQRVGMKHAIPFGPWMLAGAWVGIVWGDAVMAGYLRLAGLA